MRSDEITRREDGLIWRIIAEGAPNYVFSSFLSSVVRWNEIQNQIYSVGRRKYSLVQADQGRSLETEQERKTDVVARTWLQTSKERVKRT
jgi:hypothetical protein